MTERAHRSGFLRERTVKFYLPFVVMLFIGMIIIFRSISEKSQIANWKSYYFRPLGLSLKVPSELTVHTEEPKPGRIFTAYIDNFPSNASYSEDKPYQLYIIWSKDYSLTREEFNQRKNGLDWLSIRNTTIDGYPAIKGQIQGERNRFVTYIYKDERLISLYTAEPTKSNKNLTDKILATFSFQP